MAGAMHGICRVGPYGDWVQTLYIVKIYLHPTLAHSRPQSHFHSVTRWKLGSGLHDQMERSDWLLREPANYHAH
jgi:hypothetical protein